MPEVRLDDTSGTWPLYLTLRLSMMRMESATTHRKILGNCEQGALLQDQAVILATMSPSADSNPDSMSAHAMCTGAVSFGAYNKALDAVKQLIFICHADEVKCTSDFGIGHESEAHARLLLTRMFG